MASQGGDSAVLNSVLMDVRWEDKLWAECTPDDVFDWAKLRTDIFFLEQHIDEEELDAWDRHPKTRHVFATDHRGAVAYCRLVRNDSPDPADDGISQSIGRVVVRSDYRGKGLGHELLRRVLRHVGEEPVVLHAQEWVMSLYAAHGFEPFGEAFDEAGIPHRRMRRPGALTPQ